MENRIYQIIIICLLIVLAIFLVKAQTGHYQISLNNVLNTRTGEMYVIEKIADSEKAIWLWRYVGKPKKTIDSEKQTDEVVKKILTEKQSEMKYLGPLKNEEKGR
jgi:hypothetical protein